MKKSMAVFVTALLAALSMSIFFSHATSAQSGKSLTAQAESVAEIAEPEGGTIIWDQTANQTTSGALAIYDLDGPETWAVQGADDFVVPAGEYWNIDSVIAYGFYQNLSNAASTTRFYIYEDDGGLPGAEAYSYTFAAPAADADGVLTMVMEETVILPEGTYWVSVQPEMDYFLDGQWFWFMESAQTGNAFAWRNPGNGYGTGCTDWGYGLDCAFSEPDLTFQITGSLFVPTDVSLTDMGGEATGANLWVFAALLSIVGFSGALVYRRSRQL